MLSKRLITTACAAAILTTMSAIPARAQQPLDSRTEFTFNQPVELPGLTLPAGTYIFRFVDATTGRKVMQVQAKDQSNKTYGMFLTISAQRPRPSDEAELRETIVEFRADELEHRDSAREAGATNAVGYPLLTAAIRAGCRAAIALSKRI